jgi:hypothetical protein
MDTTLAVSRPDKGTDFLVVGIEGLLNTSQKG